MRTPKGVTRKQKAEDLAMQLQQPQARSVGSPESCGSGADDAEPCEDELIVIRPLKRKEPEHDEIEEDCLSQQSILETASMSSQSNSTRSSKVKKQKTVSKAKLKYLNGIGILTDIPRDAVDVDESLHATTREMTSNMTFHSRISFTTIVKFLYPSLKGGNIVRLTENIKPESVRDLGKFLETVSKYAMEVIHTAIKNAIKAEAIDRANAALDGLDQFKLKFTKENPPNQNDLPNIYEYFVGFQDFFIDFATTALEITHIANSRTVRQIYLRPVLNFSRADRGNIGRFYNDDDEDYVHLRSVVALKGCFRDSLFCDYLGNKLVPFAIEIDMEACHQNLLRNILKNHEPKLKECFAASQSALDIVNAAQKVFDDMCGSSKSKEELRKKIAQAFKVKTSTLELRKAQKMYYRLLCDLPEETQRDVLLEALKERGIHFDPNNQDLKNLEVDDAKTLLLRVMFGGSPVTYLREIDAVLADDKQGKIEDFDCKQSDVQAIWKALSLEDGGIKPIPNFLKFLDDVTEESAKPFVKFSKCLEQVNQKRALLDQNKAKAAAKAARHAAKAAAKAASAESCALALYLQSLEAVIIYYTEQFFTERNIPCYLYLYDGIYVDKGSFSDKPDTPDPLISDLHNYIQERLGFTVSFGKKCLTPIKETVQCENDTNEPSCAPFLRFIDNLARVMYWIGFHTHKFHSEIVQECVNLLAHYGLYPQDNCPVPDCLKTFDISWQKSGIAGLKTVPGNDHNKILARRPLVEYISKFYALSTNGGIIRLCWSKVNPRFLIHVVDNDPTVQKTGAVKKGEKKLYHFTEFLQHAAANVKIVPCTNLSFKTLDDADSAGDVRNPDNPASMQWEKMNTHYTYNNKLLGKQQCLPKSFLKYAPYQCCPDNYKKQVNQTTMQYNPNETTELSIYQDFLLHNEYVRAHGVPVIDPTLRGQLLDFIRTIPLFHHLYMLGDLNKSDVNMDICEEFIRAMACRFKYPLCKIERFLLIITQDKGTGKSLISIKLIGDGIVGSLGSIDKMRDKSVHEGTADGLFITLSLADLQTQFKDYQGNAAVAVIDELPMALDTDTDQQDQIKENVTNAYTNAHTKHKQTVISINRALMFGCSNHYMKNFIAALKRRRTLLASDRNHPAVKHRCYWVEDDGQQIVVIKPYATSAKGEAQLGPSRSQTIGSLIDNRDWGFCVYRTLMNMDRSICAPSTFREDRNFDDVSMIAQVQSSKFPFIDTFTIREAYLIHDNMKYWHDILFTQTFEDGHLHISWASFQHMFADYFKKNPDSDHPLNKEFASVRESISEFSASLTPASNKAQRVSGFDYVSTMSIQQGFVHMHSLSTKPAKTGTVCSDSGYERHWEYRASKSGQMCKLINFERDGSELYEQKMLALADYYCQYKFDGSETEKTFEDLRKYIDETLTPKCNAAKKTEDRKVRLKVINVLRDKMNERLASFRTYSSYKPEITTHHPSVPVGEASKSQEGTELHLQFLEAAQGFWGENGLVHNLARSRIFSKDSNGQYSDSTVCQCDQDYCECSCEQCNVNDYGECLNKHHNGSCEQCKKPFLCSNPCFYSKLKQMFVKGKKNKEGQVMDLAQLYPLSYPDICNTFGKYKLKEFSDYLTKEFFKLPYDQSARDQPPCTEDCQESSQASEDFRAPLSQARKRFKSKIKDINYRAMYNKNAAGVNAQNGPRDEPTSPVLSTQERLNHPDCQAVVAAIAQEL